MIGHGRVSEAFSKPSTLRNCNQTVAVSSLPRTATVQAFAHEKPLQRFYFRFSGQSTSIKPLTRSAVLLTCDQQQTASAGGMAAAVQRKQHLSDDEDTSSSNIDGVTQQPAAQEPANGHSAGAAKAAVAAAAKRLHRQPLFKRLNQRISRLKYWLWSLIEDLFEVRPAVLSTCFEGNRNVQTSNGNG
jgi:hypothetical protein